jgi:XRE family aerobic/anaerobic benzoate catabolism transcriptional regulator
MLALGCPKSNTAAVAAPGGLKSAAVEPPTEDALFLRTVGSRVRELRESLNLTRRTLAAKAEVSERYLGQLETGDGNISIMLLRRVAGALDVSMLELLDTESDYATRRSIRQFLDQIPRHRLDEVLARLARGVSSEREARRERIALIGLRGAGKSTLGARLAREFNVPFVEMDREIEAESGLPLAELFSLYGQAGYRRFEGRCLTRIVEEYPRAVLSVGGGVVSEPGTYELLLSSCLTVWLKARPEEYMQRVIAQGDMRPMADSPEALADLKRILSAREPQYRKADEILDTSGLSIDEAFARLTGLVDRSKATVRA